VNRAIEKLNDLRKHLDGCGAMPDSADWVVVCTDQIAGAGTGGSVDFQPVDLETDKEDESGTATYTQAA
jgi:hypothetical protein